VSSILERTKSGGCYKTSSILEEKKWGRYITSSALNRTKLGCYITSSILEWAKWTATNFIHLGKNKSGYYITSSILERTTWAASLLHNLIDPEKNKLSCNITSFILETEKWTATNVIHPGNSKVGCSRATYPFSSWLKTVLGCARGRLGRFTNRTHGLVMQRSQQSDIPVKPDSDFL
jgi:hypothetical protein